MNGAKKVFVGAAISAAAIACGDYARMNPYDANVSVSITIAGPDTLFSVNEQAHYTAVSAPVFPDSAIEWGSRDTFALTPAGYGTFRSSAPPLYPATNSVIISALIGHLDTTKTVSIGGLPVSFPDVTWRHHQEKTLVLTQRVTRIQLRCPVAACDTISAGSAWSVWVDGFDALNHQIYSLTSATANPLTGTALAAFAVRDAAIASVAPVGIRASKVTAVKSGSTWIVATRGTLLDSLRLIVR